MNQVNKMIIDDNSTALQLTQKNNLSGLCAVVTGANQGLGLEIVKALAFVGCHVVMACRNGQKAHEIRESLLKERVHFLIFFWLYQ
jgi:short-subunit dehydrogenase